MRAMRLCLVFLLLAFPAAARAASLPPRLFPQPPFPLVRTQAPTFKTIAPGVDYGEYLLGTDAGPLAVRVVAVDLHRNDLHVGTVLAHDVLTSAGETISSMAARTSAIAGINGDYFDIGNTNRPTNILVRNGTLVRSPRKRYALVIGSDRIAHFDELAFAGTLGLGDRTAALDAVNVLPPPNDGTALLTPQFGAIAPSANLMLIALEPQDGALPFVRYRVLGVVDNLVRAEPGYYLAVDVNAYGAVGVPNNGDTIDVQGDLSPIALGSMTAAIGGGPLILRDGAWFDDPDGPNGGEFALRIPSSGAAVTSDGTLLLIEVDGREPDDSVGVTRPEFAALMRALGAQDGIAFDGGGSSALVVRQPGDLATSLTNSPSDGLERPVSDGIFVYSDAPLGDPMHIVAAPTAVRAVVGATIALRLATTDDAGHPIAPPAAIDARVEPASLGTYQAGIFFAARAGHGHIVAHSAALTLDVPIDVVETPARISIVPHEPNVDQNAHLRLAVRAYDADGYPLALPARLAWRAHDGRIDDGLFTAQTHDADVSVAIGERMASTHISVGSHAIPLDVANVRFETVPRGGDGAVTYADHCPPCIGFRFALGASERAAYAIADLAMPNDSVGIAFDLEDDGDGARVRIALRNAINEQVLLTATTLDHPGWRRVTVRFPPNLAQPVRFVGIYTIGERADATHVGTIRFRDIRALVAGATPP